MSQIRKRRGTQRITMDDVARHLGVSSSTVSLYLRSPERVSPSMSKRIEEAIARLGYIPNVMAGGLASSRSNIVGVIVPSIANSFFARTLESLEIALQQYGYRLLIGHSGYDERREEELIQSFLGWSPAALIVTGLEHSRRSQSLLAASQIPIVEMWDSSERPLDLVIGFSHTEVGEISARHLHERGFRKPAWIGVQPELDSRAGKRLDGFARYWQEHGWMVPTASLPGRSNAAEAGSQFLQLRQQNPDIDALYLSSDLIALGVLFECQREGIVVPDQLGLLGFGDIGYASACVPALSTIAIPHEAIGERITQMLLSRWANSAEAYPTRETIQFELIPRGST